MLNKRKKSREKIIISILTIIAIFVFFINFIARSEKDLTKPETYSNKVEEIANDEETEHSATAAEAKRYNAEEVVNAETGLRLAATTVGIPKGKITPIYRPKWEKVSSSFNKTNGTLTVVIKGTAYESQTINSNLKINYASDVESTLTADNIAVFVDGKAVTGKDHPSIKVDNKTVSTNQTSGKKEVTYTVTLSNFVEASRQSGKPYKEWSGNVGLKIGGRGQSESTYSANVLTDEYGNQSMMEIQNQDGNWVNIDIKDDETDHNTEGVMFTDYVKPELTYVYSSGNINRTDKTLTVEFSVVDKYFQSTILSGANVADLIKLTLKDTNTQIPDAKITKTLSKTEDIKEDRDGDGTAETKIGEKYKLVISGLEQRTVDGKYKDYSGPMSITFPANLATDKSGNTNSTTSVSLTVGVDEPGGNASDEKVVDVVDPVWKTENVNIDHTNNKLTVDLVGTDKYYASNSLTADKIKVIVDGEEVKTTTNVKKSLSSATALTETRDGKSVQYGVKYTLTITDWEEATKQTSPKKDYFEWSGTTQIQIAAETLTDESQNKSKAQTFDLGQVDFIKPKIEEVSKSKDTTAQTETFVFNVIDKYLNTDYENVRASYIKVYVDGEDVTTVNKTVTKVKDLTATVNGKTKIIGQQYQVVLSNFEKTKTTINFDREYSDWSGTTKLVILADAARDISGNASDETTINGEFVDYVKPNLTYQFAESNVDKVNKTFTMVFDMTDKHYDASTSTALNINDLTIKIDGKVPDWTKVSKTLKAVDRSNTVNGVSKVVGKRYTLELSNLEQLQIKDGDKYLDYSGVVTVGIPANKMADTSGNKNNAATLTSGIDLPGGNTSDKEVVDVVDPLIEKLSTSANAVDKTATVKFRVTDKYFRESTLTKDNIQAIINGTETTTGITKTLTSTPLTEQRTENGTTSTVKYGMEYTATITGFASDANQVKLRIPAGLATDTSGNGNKETDLIIYNTLKKTNTETEATSGFLGSASNANTNIKAIQRQDIDNVTFVNSTAGKNSNTWDVSAQGDNSILAWYTQNANGSYKVYIGSDYEIFANSYSTNLFTYVGYSTKCTSTETISNINLLNVSSTYNMQNMFRFAGYNAMTKLDLGNNFDTSNVENMIAMFGETGIKKMTTFNLGSKFSTSKVKDMSWMFCKTGNDELTTLNLGDKFDTSNVTSMYNMFRGTGYTKLTSLSLGNKFNTSKVTNMQEMFRECGYTAMTTLNLGANFDTSKVTDMNNMFNSTGYTAMTSLALGDRFDTSKVTNMSNMFDCTGYTAMTSLDLGEKFDTSSVTNMSHMFDHTGYRAMTSLDLGDKFDTSSVTNMSHMFDCTGYKAMTSLDLGDKFDTSNVTNMNQMFCFTGYTAMTSLKLGNKFNTSKVTDMREMFDNTGYNAMTSLDLGPAFTTIATGSLPNERDSSKTEEANVYMFRSTGKDGAVTIYASEQIYQDKNNFKLNASATTSTINYTRGTINAKYRTEWVKEKSEIDTTNAANPKMKVTLRGRTNAEAGEDFTSDVESTLKASDLKVYVDGEDVSNIIKVEIGTASQTANATTGAKDVLQVVTLSNLIETSRRTGKSYLEWSGNVVVEVPQKTLKDTTYNNQNTDITSAGARANHNIKDETLEKNTTGKMFEDYIKPEFTYKSSDTTIVRGEGEKIEVTFDVVDKYFASSKLSSLEASQITVGIDDYEKTKLNKDITKKLEKVQDLTGTVNGKANTKIGERYKLTITNLDQKDENGLGDGYKYSGYMSLSFAAGAITDKSGNPSVAKTITIGKNEPNGTGNGTIVDVVDPVWTVPSADTENGLVKIRVQDKYLVQADSKFELTKEKIKVIVNGKESGAIVKQLTGPVEITKDQVYEYTLILSNITPAKSEYTEFTPIDPIVGGTAKYKNENGGNIALEMEAGTVTDKYGNKTNKQTLQIGNIDGTGPEIYDVQKTKNPTNNKETFIFNVTDKNYNSEDLITADELSVWLDGKQVDDSITKEITKAVEIKTTIDGEVKTVGHQYTLEIGSIVETDAEFMASKRTYRELSGTLQIKIDTTAARDMKGNTINEETCTLSDFNDMIKPEVIYKYSTSDISYDDKTFTMAFDIVDKYYDSTKSKTLKVEDLTIKVDGKVPDWSKVTRSLGVTETSETFTATEPGNINGTIKNVTKVVKRHYVLTLSNLEQLQIKEGDKYLDYSGVITVGIPEGIMVDTAGNKNIAKTITSGVSIPGGNASDEKIVDVVDPLIEKISTSASGVDKTATINFRVTDKYFKASTLTRDNIEVWVNGAKVTSGLTKTLTSTDLKEDKTTGSTTTSVQYGIDYTMTITGFAPDVNQVKIKIPQGLVTDNSGNGNKETEIIAYNVLKEATAESEETSEFLGSASSANATVKAIQRQNIDNITFVNSTSSKNANVWDVSAQGDNSILAWCTKNSNGSYQVNIGSDYEIFGNQNSSCLFGFIGSSNKCTSTETITGIDLLNVASVINMKQMFRRTGFIAMTKLDLGDKFDTSNVTNMESMFDATGYQVMTDFDLGNSFDTGKVTNMQGMFTYCGYTNLINLDLGSKFNTSNVTNMSYMFRSTGYTAMTNLNLGAKFNTSKVTNMEAMFLVTGKISMTSLKLGDNFDTSNVTTMRNMFNACGYKKMTTLNLGNKFNTKNVIDMSLMFRATSITNLDLGENFDTSKVTNMEAMFESNTRIVELNLGKKFDTSNVTNMMHMFKDTGYDSMTSLSLGDKFYTKSVTEMYGMFENCGASSMISLDLGPAFNFIQSVKHPNKDGMHYSDEKIPEHNSHDNMFTNTGKSGAITIYTSEQIYLDKNNFKLDTNSTDSAINYTRGTINPRYRTEWIKESSALTIDKNNLQNSKITVTLRGRTNEEAGKDFTSNVTSSLTADNIHVYFDGVESTQVKKSLANAVGVKNATTEANDVTQVLTISGLDDARKNGKTYTEWSGNISLKIDKKTLKDDTYANQNLSAIDTSGTMTDIEIKEAENVKANANGTMFIDSIRPEFTYVYSNGNIDRTNKTLTVDFSVADKYLDSSKTKVLENIDNIAIKLIDTDPNVTIPNDKIKKGLTKIEDINDTINGETVKVGEKYRLVISGLEQQTADGEYKDYSGPMSISIPAGVATDLSGNSNIAKTFTIGVNEPDGTGNQEIVDVVDPLWKTENINIDNTNNRVTVDLVGTDKYYASNSLTTDKIKVYVDNEEVKTTVNVVKTLSQPTKEQYGVRYTLTLDNWEEATKQTGKEFFEWSGTTKIEIAKDTLTDESNNKSKVQEFELGHVDFIKPKIEKISSAKDATAKTETIVFDVFDKYLDTSDLVTTDEISVYVDNELVPKGQITRTLTKVSDLSGVVGGTSKIIGHQYKLVLSDFEQARTAINYDREYSDWSGDVSIKIAKGAVKDTNKPIPNENDETTIDGDFIDFIKPNATYKYTNSDIDYNGKTFTMVFDVTDKYYTSGNLTIDDLNIMIDGETPNWDNTGVHGVVKELISEDIKNTVKGASKVIGKKYTLKLSHLEQLEKLAGKETMDYSGVITVAIPKDKIADTSGNKNNAITITSGIEVKGEPVTGNGTVVDVVDPIWERVSSSASAASQTATITVKGTDKYFKSSALTSDKIKVIINGKEVSTNVKVEVGTATPEYATDETTRIGDRYTIKVSGSGLAKDADQIKVQIQPNAITDNSGNTNKVTDLLVYNALKKTNTEDAKTSPFLGNTSIERQNVDNVTVMDNIPSSVYDKSAQTYVDATAWDVSAMQDKSILAWYTTNGNGTVKVYIGSDNEIFGNYDSSNLFDHVGFSDNATATETITNIGLLNVSSVNKMERMFRYTGYTAMTSLDLGDNFDTTNVTSMFGMFAGTGYTKMETLNLGSKFNTNNVNDMTYMFIRTGYTAMTSLDLGVNFNTSNVMDMSHMFEEAGYTGMTSLNLGANFNTSNVTNMSNMFVKTGYTKMTNLNLGAKFNTNKVTDMSSMFKECGHDLMTTLELGDNFDTSNVENMNSMFWKMGELELKELNLKDKFNTKNVTNMSAMFSSTGANKMTTLSLGDKFDTSNVTTMNYMFQYTGAVCMTSFDLGDRFYTTKVEEMNNMFYNTGRTAMTTLDLGPAFTKIASANTDMFTTTGKDGVITIHASEQIYLDKNNFKLNTNAETSAIEYTRGIINPKYRTNWANQSVVISEANKNITITLRGSTNPEAGKEHTSNVTSTLTADDIHVYFDGEEATDITKTLAAATTTANAVTGANDVLQVLTLSNLEETLRQQGKEYKEWSGNISLKINKKTLNDIYGNQNLKAIDTTGEMVDIVIQEDELLSKNTAGKLFTDYIKPEFTYEYSDTEINYTEKNVKVVFSVTDKYFEQSKVSLEKMTIKVDGIEPDWTKVSKTLTKKTLDADVTDGNTIYKANGDIYTIVNGKEQKIGERYELAIDKLETKNAEGYSGPMTIAFPEDIVTDKSGNKNLAKTITIGIDDPGHHENHKDPVIVDLVNPQWSYGTSSINRVRDGAEADTVDVTIIGSDKYYKSNSLTTDNIKVYVDGKLEASITKELQQITDASTLKALAVKQKLEDAQDLKLVGYKLTLGNFGKINGETKITIDAGTIFDESDNTNIKTEIPVGNPEWVEVGDSADNPKYLGFRNNIVDFIKPVIKYTYSAVNGATNPDINYEDKTLTVKFVVTDKHIRQNSIMNEDGSLNTDNIRIKVANTDLTDRLHTTVSSVVSEDGTETEYTFVVSNFELVYDEANKYQDYSGAVDFVFAADKVDDTSGNKNSATTITLDYDDGDDTDNPVIVDVIDPLIEKTADNLSILNSSNAINRDITNETGTVSLRIRASDKYLDQALLQNAENVAKMKVKVVKPDGETVYPDTITKQVSQVSKQATSVIYQITLGNFGENEGVTSIIIPEGVIIDKYGNKNKETEILVGNATWVEAGDSKGEYTAFKNSIVDFTRPTWEYSTSSITRDRDNETGTVTVKILGRDKYYLKDTLTEDNIFVYVDNIENPDKPVKTITKQLTKITNTAELDGADTGYTLTLGNFGTYDGAVKISISDNTIKDTSGNGNKITEIPVGNKNWVETDIGDSADNPKYTAFRNDIVDFIKPTIKYKYSEGANPVIDQENKQVKITFDVVDTNFLESDILTATDIKQILVDDYDVTTALTKQLTSSDITDGSGNGIRYTLTLSNFELDENLQNEIFRRHSGKIEFVIAEGKVRDTSGNTNIETKIIVDNDNGDDENNYIRADFIKPKLFYVDKFISYAQRYATITIAGTDRFYDFNAKLNSSDISVYQLNRDGQYVQRTDLPITITPVKTEYGYNFVVRLGEFEEEFRQLKISIPAGKIADLDGHTNDATDIFVDLDNKKPVWEYISTDTSKFESDGKISFTVKGQDTFLDIAKSGLEASNIRVLKDGTDVTEVANVTVNYLGADESEVSKSYEIDISGLQEIGSYSLVIEKETLVDEFANKSATTTITFSKSAISSNTDNYTMVTYHTSPDFKQTHQSYIHELMSVNESGTNAESTTYRASSLGEIYDNGNNPLFAEPFNYSFKGWAEADEKGFSAADAKVYGIYDDIPKTVTHLNAVWQEATVVFVSTNGDNSNDGKSPEKPVKDINTAYSKLNSNGTSSNNIIVIMDKVEWNSSDTLTGNATITSLYAGVDYRTDGAELKISSNMNINGDVTFDNIKLYSSSTTVSDGSDYLAAGNYSNVLVTNYGDVILGRGVSTPDDKYTFGAVVGGNYKDETTKNTIGIHTVIVEAGKYNNIIVGSSLNSPTTSRKYVSHQVILGTMKEAAISRNDKLTITGYLAMGELENRCYPYNRDGSQDTTLGYTRYYAITKVYSAKFTGDNKFKKASEDASIYLRSINGFNDGKVKFEMYGANVTGNIYGGARMATTKDKNETSQPEVNILNFYGGQITGNIFGHGDNDTSTGNSTITLQGCFGITGNVFGGSNATTEGSGKVTGDTNITVNSTLTIDGNIYGGSNGVIVNATVNRNTGLITGNTNVTLNVGTVKQDVFGGGYNSGVTGESNITINNGQIIGNVYGGSYQNQVQTTSNINILGGSVQDVYGGNVLTTVAQLNSDYSSQNTNVIIGSKDIDTTPTVNGAIYGSGKYDRVGNATVKLIKCATIPTVYGGSNSAGYTTEANIYLNDMTASSIYGGSNLSGTVTTSNVYLQSGTVTDVYGGGYGGITTTSNVNLDGTATVTSIYGGANTDGSVGTSNVDLRTGNVTNAYGGGDSTSVGTTNIALNGVTIDSLHGGSKKSGVATNTNVVLNRGTATDVYGGGYDVGATNTKVTLNGGITTNIYGGSHGGYNNTLETTNSVVNINGAYAKNVYGGNMGKGTVRYATINITGASSISGKLFGGGYQSDIGKTANTGSATINIAGGTIRNDIVGGSERGTVYGTTNINIGKDAITDSSLQANNIAIGGDIYGAGDAINTDYSTSSVYGETHVTLDNGIASQISFAGSIFGAGKGANYTPTGSSDNSTVRIKDFGSLASSYKMVSIQRTGKVYIQTSYLELTGAQDKYNFYKNTSYTLNRVTNGLALLDNSTLYTRRGFNMVGGFESLLTTGENSTEKATATIANDKVTRNVDNRIYTFEGVNLIFAKEEGDLSEKSNQDIWGDVNGMAFFGMYRINRSTGSKEYDIYAPDYSGKATNDMFANGTYIEGRHKNKHDITVDGFYTNVEDGANVVPQVIDVTDNGTYYDWIVGADIVNYTTSLIASTYSTYSMADLDINFKQFVDNVSYNGTTFTVSRVSANAFDTDANLVNKLNIPTYSENANNTFGLTMQTSNSGWLKGGTTNLYTDSNGSFDGVSVYKTDNSAEPGSIIFKLFNSVNVSETKDLGYMNIVITGKARQGEDASIGKVFKVVISVNIQTLKEDLNTADSANYIARFTENSGDTELNYTTDSSIDMTYVLYKTGLKAQSDIYASGDYRVLSTSTPLPKGTKVTLKDYGQGNDSNKVYYYQVASDADYDATDNASGSTRYLYKLSKFIDIGGTSSSYKYNDDNSKYYHVGSVASGDDSASEGNNGYVLEKYDVSIDFMDSGLDTNKLAQESYIELRSSSGALKYDNGDKDIKYNLYNKNAVMSENVITDDGKTSYSVYENLSIPFTFDSSLLEQSTESGATIQDTKYYSKISGMAVEIVDEHGERIKAPDVQNLKITDNTESTSYSAGTDGVIRIPIADGLSKINNSYTLGLSQSSVPAGQYIAKIYFFASDDGKYFGGEAVEVKEIYITFINKKLGLAGLESADGSRIMNKDTGLNLDGGKGLDLTVKVGSPTDDTNIRVELYKRIATYKENADGTTTYNGISYTKVDLKDYLQNLDGSAWKTPEDCTGQNLITADGCTEYMVMEKSKHALSSQGETIETVDFKKAIKNGIGTGEYKLVFKAYYQNTLIQTIRKTFIVVP